MSKPVFNYFSFRLLQWHDNQNKRTMPWKGEKDPYKIWLSEIILQQTRVQQGLAYYNKFITAFPTIQLLANAKDEVVYKLWEGLGYYSRCKNLLYTAREVASMDEFPNSYNDILKLKGIGPYTAAAISSFAFGLAHAVVDGNVYRVLSRFFGESVPIDSTKGKAFFNELANKLLYQPDPSKYNQAIMDFGALICTPQLPKCIDCPLNDKCVALKRGIINLLPIKEKKLVKTIRWFNYFVFVDEMNVLVKLRTEKGIWQNLHEFYLYETGTLIKWNKKKATAYLKKNFPSLQFEIQKISGLFKQTLTHQLLSGQFIMVQIKQNSIHFEDFKSIPISQISELAFPKMINTFLMEYYHPLQTKQGNIAVKAF